MSALHRSMQGIGRPADRPIDHPCAPSLRGGHTQPFVRQRQSRLRRETSTASVHPTPSREVARGIDRETACHADSRRLSSRAARPRCSRLLATPRVLRGRSPERSSTPPRPLLAPAPAPARVPSGQVPGRAPSVRSRSAACWLRDPEPFRDPVPTRHEPPRAATSRHEPPRASIPRPNPHIADRAPHAHA